MVSLLGGRGASAVMGFFMLALASSEATAQSLPALNVPAAVRALESESNAKPLSGGAIVTSNIAAPVQAPAVTPAIVTTTGDGGAKLPSASLLPQPAQTVTVRLPTSIDREAAWLYKSGWPLYALVDRYGADGQLDEQANCIATAVYFEARGESLEGQLAVARVIMNRAASGRYPASWCAVVKQPLQFSFVRNGQFPAIDAGSSAWRKAQGVARLAIANVVPSVQTDVLWYHATYVAPSWRRSLREAEHIGAHIFYHA